MYIWILHKNKSAIKDPRGWKAEQEICIQMRIFFGAVVIWKYFVVSNKVEFILNRYDKFH